MSANPDMNVQMNAGLMDSLLEVNQLAYRLPPQISISSRCTHVIQYSNQPSYTGNTIVFEVQTGSQFCDPAASYIRLNVKPDVAGFGFGSGSVKNMFVRVVVRTASGKELSRVEDANVLMRMMDVYDNSKDWRNTVGRSQGYSVSNTDGTVTNTLYSEEVSSTTGKVFCIPIQSLIPCMNPVGGNVLVPSNIMSGLRIELGLASASDAFSAVNQSTGVTDLTGYVVSECELHLKVYELADAFQRKIQEIASSSGLNYLYKEHFHGIVSTTTNQINYDIKKACSKALTARMCTRPAALSAGKDKFQTSVFDYNKIQSNIGSDYFPNQPLQINGTPTINNINEAYYYSLYAQNKLLTWSPPGISPNEFFGTTDFKTYNNGVISFNFNKSQVSDLSGYTTSNSRALLVNLQRSSTVAIRIDVYLTFLRLCKAYLSNVVVLD